MDPVVTGPTIPTTISNRVSFNHAFPIPPKVVVWLVGLSAPPGAAVSVQVTANNITETNFVLQICSGDRARLGSVGVAWAVWPDASGWQQTAVDVGSVSTLTPGQPRRSTLGAKGTLPGTTKLFVAVCAVDLVLSGGLWVDLVVAHAGGGWSMNAGPSTAIVYSARVAHVSK